MPGIYIDPTSGSQITSTLGNILGGIATNMDPKTQAEAQELRIRTMGEDLANQKLRGIIAGATGIPSITGSANAEPAPPAGGVAGTLAGAAVPPTADTGPAPGTFGGGAVNAGFAPMARILAGSYLNNPDMGNLTTGINLGKDITTGPGTDYATGNTIAIAHAAPQHVGSGDTLVIDPTKGNAPGNVIVGQSPYDQKVADTMAGAAPPEAKHDIDVGGDATVNLGKAQAIQKIYDSTVAPEYTPGGILSEKAAANLAAYFGLPVADILKMGVPGAKQLIRKQFAGMVSNLRDNMGNPLIKGSLDTIMSQFPDPDAAPDQFRAAMQTLTTTLQQQAADGQAAEAWYAHPTQQGYVALLHQKALNAAIAKAAFANIGIHDTAEGGGGGGGGGGGAGGGGGGDLPVVSTPEEARKLPKGTKFKTPDGRIGTSNGPGG